MSSFDALVSEAAASLAEALAREQRSLAPDFAAVVEEAHARDPKRVPAAALAEVRALAPVVDLRSDAATRPPRREQAEFAALLAEARAEIDADTAAAAAAGPPGVPVLEVRRGPRRAWAWLAAAAAIAGLAFGLRPLLTRGEATDESALQAPWQDQASPPRHEVAPTPAPAQPRVLPRPAGPALEVAPEEPPVAPVEPSRPIEDDGKGRSKETGSREHVSKGPARPRGETPAERLRRLDGEAEAKWQAGDLAGAEALYREIAALAPGGRAADLAYGDLFSLARQRYGADQEVALWREYLQLFPRGRYADDARAGLCRRAADDARACWSAYVTDFPDGVHRRQAARVLAEAEP